MARFAPHLQQRWAAGCRDAVVLYQELRALGFEGSYDMVRRWVRPWRTLADAAHTPGPKPRKALEAPTEHVPSSHQVGWWLVQQEPDREERDQQFLDHLLPQCPELSCAATLAARFGEMIRPRQAPQLDAFLKDATGEGVPREMIGFAKGLQQDRPAVQAALSLEWSQGPVEGQINRLKFIKRQMYGRAGLALAVGV